MNEIIYSVDKAFLCDSTGVVPAVGAVVVHNTLAYRVKDVTYFVSPAAGADHHTHAVVRLVLIGVADDFTVFGG